MKQESSTTGGRRILVISEYAPPDIAGSATRTRNLIKALHQSGHDVELITAMPHYPDGPPNKGYPGFYTVKECERVKAYRITMPPVSHHSNAGRMLNYVYFTIMSSLMVLLSGTADIVFAQSPNFFVWFSGIFAKMVKRAPLISNVDDLWPEALEDLGIVKSKRVLAIVRAIRSFCFRLSDRIVCISSAIETHIRNLGVPDAKVSTVEVGYDFSNSKQQSSPKTSKTEKQRILYSGALGPAYDFGILVQLAEKLEKTHNQAEIVIKGRGPESARIRKMLIASTVENVILMNQWLSKEEYRNMLLEVDVFILPMKNNFISRTAIPTKLIEYMAMARPIIVFGRGNVAKLVHEANCGIVIEDGSVDAAVRFLQEIRDGRRNAVKLGRNGKQYARRNLSISSIAHKMEAILQNIDKRGTTN